MKPTFESETAEHWQKWQPQHFDAAENQADCPSLPVLVAPEPLPDAENQQADPVTLSETLKVREQEHQRIWQEGYQQGVTHGEQSGHDAGYQAGLQAGQQQSAEQQHQQQQQVCRLADNFAHSLEVLDGVITSRILQLALQIALQISGEAARCDSHQLTDQIRGLLQQDPLFTGTPRLRVHPQDLPLAEQLFAEQLDARGWKAEADPLLNPGDCLLQGEEGELDCSISTRWLELCQRAKAGDY